MELSYLCSRTRVHRQPPFGVEFIEPKDVYASIMSPDLDVAVVRSVPLIELFENVNLMPAEMKSPGHRHSAMVSMLLDVNTHFWFQGYIRFVGSAVQCCRAGFLARASLSLPLLSLPLPPDEASPV
jgi:hypothetical protein